MKTKIQAMLSAKETRKAEIISKVEKSEDVAEVKSLTADLDAINVEIRELSGMLIDLPDEVDVRTQTVNKKVPDIVKPTEKRAEGADDDIEYRKAFMNYVTRGVVIPAEFRSDETTKTSDVEAVIPTVIVNRIVEKLEAIGMILPLVNRTSYQAGVEIPVMTLKPVATWVAEGATSEKQKTTTAKVSFVYHKLRCEIAMTHEVNTMSISAFETTFINSVAKAMVKAIEAAIIAGDGIGKAKGILEETAETGQSLEVSALDYKTLVDAEAALPQEYESGAVWCMTKKTFMGFIGMVDQQKQPIARVNYGIGGKPERYLLGREVVLCGTYMDSFSATLEAGKVFAFLFNFDDYTLNTIYDMGVQRRQDWDTEDHQIKAVMSVDGKVVDKGSLVTLAKAA